MVQHLRLAGLQICSNGPEGNLQLIKIFNIGDFYSAG